MYILILQNFFCQERIRAHGTILPVKLSMLMCIMKIAKEKKILDLRSQGQFDL